MKGKRFFVVLFVILVGLLAASVASNFYIFDFARLYYLQLNGQRLDPLGLDSYREPPQPESEAGAVRVVFFGDSRAESWPAPEMAGFEFINRGISAQTSAQTIGRYEAHIRPLSFDVLVVQVCINDLKTIPLFPRLKREIIGDCKDNIEAITELAREQGAAVILTTIFPVGEVPLERQIFWSDEIPAAILEVNGFIESLAGDGVVVFDAYIVLADENGEMRREYRFDELHLNADGYEALNQAFEEVLRPFGEGGT